jgi:hypothetical protein
MFLILPRYQYVKILVASSFRMGLTGPKPSYQIVNS